MRNRAVLIVLFAVAFPIFAAPPEAAVPDRADDAVLVASFNIKWFARQTQDLSKIARVIAHFDLCGIIELQSDDALSRLRQALEAQTGDEWMYICSHDTGDDARYLERYGFVWRTGRVHLASGFVGNLFQPANSDIEDRHRHAPYTAFFRAGGFDFACILAHTVWSTATRRKREVALLGQELEMLRGRTTERDLLLMGDFNYPVSSPAMASLTESLGLRCLEPEGVGTTIKADGSASESAYDHILVSGSATVRDWTGRSGAYYFVPALYPDGQGAARASSEVSDHLPVWAEFHTGLADDD